MQFRILGSFEVIGSEGLVDLRGAKRRGLLAYLVMHRGQPISIDRLVEELWDERGTAGAARTVQTYVSQLRKLFLGEPPRLETRPGGYVLDVDPDDVDAYRFERGLVAAGAEGDAVRRLAMLDETFELWRGPPMEEFAGSGWADLEATRLGALHLQALRRRYDTLLELGRAGEAVGELETLVDTHPLDEKLWAQLMLGLYRSGRQADALGAYQHARHHLVDELGIEPGPELAELEHRILDHDATLASPSVGVMAGARDGQARHGTGRWSPRTFLLTDIVDSVSLWERDATAMSHAVARHDTIIRDAVRASGEFVRAKGEGDSTFSVFAHPADAVAAAAAIQEAMGNEQWPSTAPVRVRVSVHTGDAEPRDGDWYGPAVNRAARLRALANGGHIFVSGVTAGLVADQLPDAVRLLYRGRRTLRGIERPEEVWEALTADDPTAASPTWMGVGGLPAALTRFVGHTEDLDQLGRLIEGERLVTLTGPGGSGKTRLALEVARNAQRRGGRVWLAELASLRDAGSVADVVADVVGVEAGPDPVDELLAQADTLAGILVLDNCEHLLDACAELTEQLLAAAPDIQVLATSREPLRLAGEREWLVRPLDVPNQSQGNREQLAQVESVELLLDRVRAIRPYPEVSHADLASVMGICRALDGMPLAIELAAGRLRSLSFADLEARLGDQLNVLARQRSTGRDDSRHRTLRMTLDWSYDLLSHQQQTLAQRLSVFAGGFRLDAVEAVCGDLDVLDGIDELVAKSLVTFDPTTARYRLLEPIRQYLAERLERAGATEAVRRSHVEWVAALCDRLGTRLREIERPRRVRLSEETGNIDLALCWAQDHDPAMAMRIVGSLGQYWCFYDQASGRRWCDAVIAVGAGVASRSRAKALISAGMVAQNDHEWDRSVAWLREALAIYRSKGSVAGQATALYWLGRALASLPDPEHSQDHAMAATSCFQEGIQLCVQLGDSYGVGSFRLWFSANAFESGDLNRAEQLANQVIEECSAADERYPVGQALCMMAFIARRRGRDDAALELLREAVALYRDLDDPYQLSGLLVDLAEQEAVMGRGAEALQALAESSQLDEQIGRLPGRSRRLAVAALVHLARGQLGLSIAALGAHDAHPPEDDCGPRTRVGGSVGWLADAVETTRAQLDPVAVEAAAAAARHKSVDELIYQLIIQPATVPA